MVMIQLNKAHNQLKTEHRLLLHICTTTKKITRLSFNALYKQEHFSGFKLQVKLHNFYKRAKIYSGRETPATAQWLSL